MALRPFIGRDRCAFLKTAPLPLTALSNRRIELGKVTDALECMENLTSLPQIQPVGDIL